MGTKAKRNWFSNFLPFDKPLPYGGLRFRTPEHFYQAMKTKDGGIRFEISGLATPMEAKRRGRKVVLRDDWEDVKVDIMRYVLLHRFREGTEMRQRLMATEGEIVEWNHWHDKIWGKCICDECQGNGNNLLGKLLMEIRDE